MADNQVTGALTPNDDKPSINGYISPRGIEMDGNLTPLSGEINGQLGESSTRNYNHLHHKPKINHVTLEGDKSFPELGVRTVTSGEILEILDM